MNDTFLPPEADSSASGNSVEHFCAVPLLFCTACTEGIVCKKNTFQNIKNFSTNQPLNQLTSQQTKLLIPPFLTSKIYKYIFKACFLYFFGAFKTGSNKIVNQLIRRSQ